MNVTISAANHDHVTKVVAMSGTCEPKATVTCKLFKVGVTDPIDQGSTTSDDGTYAYDFADVTDTTANYTVRAEVGASKHATRNVIRGST